MPGLRRPGPAVVSRHCRASLRKALPAEGEPGRGDSSKSPDKQSDAKQHEDEGQALRPRRMQITDLAMCEEMPALRASHLCRHVWHGGRNHECGNGSARPATTYPEPGSALRAFLLRHGCLRTGKAATLPFLHFRPGRVRAEGGAAAVSGRRHRSQAGVRLPCNGSSRAAVRALADLRPIKPASGDRSGRPARLPPKSPSPPCVWLSPAHGRPSSGWWHRARRSLHRYPRFRVLNSASTLKRR
jgi:hypothetical protein